MKFPKDHWMTRSYDRYVTLGGRSRHPENFCRFMRVVFIWSPLRRFFKGRMPGLEGFTPFATSVCTILLGGVLVGFGSLIYDLSNDWMLALWVAWIVWGVCALFAIGFWLDNTSFNFRTWLRKNIIIPIQSIDAYRHARASKFCPLIEFTESNDPRATPTFKVD